MMNGRTVSSVLVPRVAKLDANTGSALPATSVRPSRTTVYIVEVARALEGVSVSSRLLSERVRVAANVPALLVQDGASMLATLRTALKTGGHRAFVSKLTVGKGAATGTAKAKTRG